MNKTTSSFLDVLRIVSALVVFVSHCAQHWSDAVSALIEPFAHHAVVVFFVLSGYVIAFATLGRAPGSATQYAVARVSRLYSVVVPAIALTVLLQLIGAAMAPDVYAQASRGSDALRYLLAATFMQSNWFLSAAPPTNGPLWSLSYEAWYYAGSGAAVFAPSRVAKVALVALVALVAGPNILLLAPTWLLGVALYVWRDQVKALCLNPAAYIAAGAVVMFASHTLLPGTPWALGTRPFYFSASFVSDWVFAVGVALLIAGVDAARVDVSDVAAARLRNLGDLTFPLYLFHFPIIFLWTATTGHKPASLAVAIPVALGILLMVVGLSVVTERYRYWWRGALQQAVESVMRGMRRTESEPMDG